MALVTWPLLYLPLLLPTFAAAFQLRPERLHERPAVRALILVAAYAGYLWLLVPTLRDAWRQASRCRSCSSSHHRCWLSSSPDHCPAWSSARSPR